MRRGEAEAKQKERDEEIAAMVRRRRSSIARRAPSCKRSQKSARSRRISSGRQRRSERPRVMRCAYARRGISTSR